MDGEQDAIMNETATGPGTVGGEFKEFYTTRPRYKSWRKKYRKMRIKFEAALKESNELFVEEQKALKLARRLQEQNDQILELLLDINDSTRVPPELRYNLSGHESGELDNLEEEDPAALQQALHRAHAAVTSGSLTEPEFYHINETVARKLKHHGTKPLARLEATVPHTYLPRDPSELPADLATDFLPGYLDSAHEDEYLASIDRRLGDASSDVVAGTVHPHALRPIPSVHIDDSEKDKEKALERDVAIHNPVSVHNWLRKNLPNNYINEKAAGGGGAGDAESEKSGYVRAAPNARNLAKRVNEKSSSSANSHVPVEKMEQDLLDEEIGLTPDVAAPGTGSASAKKRARDDDGSYRPKGGSSRPAKRKRAEGDVGGKKRIKVEKAGLATEG
ncbi:IEC3 subunit of the Ino80 complex, chromatin re-modelling-domain-containing protein [Cryomyces antarcticus]